jgi:hypothetical protein
MALCSTACMSLNFPVNYLVLVEQENIMLITDNASDY